MIGAGVVSAASPGLIPVGAAVFFWQSEVWQPQSRRQQRQCLDRAGSVSEEWLMAGNI
jgi:hypothetical protein